jgi:hypothetical protein
MIAFIAGCDIFPGFVGRKSPADLLTFSKYRRKPAGKNGSP